MVFGEMISVRDLCKAYPDGAQKARVLDGLRLEVARGEFVAVVGPSGSGKSTLLHLLGGLDVAYEGEVAVGGVSLRSLDERGLSRFRASQVGFVFQSFHLVRAFSARDNVLLPAHFGQGTIGAAQRRRADELLERVGLLAKAEQTSAQLSGGERQRVAIARALFASPPLLLCDEPTGNLDAVTGQEIIELFATLNREGLTLLCVTHEGRVSEAASRVLRLREGKLFSDGGGGS